MEIFSETSAIQNAIREIKNQGLSIGFVPTMGALHEGHLSLIRRSSCENNITVVSIFVNPLQFNNSLDLEKYPRCTEKDLHLLEKTDCNIVFLPSYDEMYPPGFSPKKYSFGHLENVMEGVFRPGHFTGVAVVVSRLFDIIAPDNSYFGEKDYQQLCIIRAMVKSDGLNVKILACPTIREDSGLAMSSRNSLLSEEQRENASVIYRTLKKASEQYANFGVIELRKQIINELQSNRYITSVEYVEFCDASSLEPINFWNDTEEIICCLAVHVEKIRLIDNIRFGHKLCS